MTTTTTTTTTTMATILEMENKKSMEERASEMNTRIEKVCGYVRRTIDVKDARDYVKQVNELIKSYNLVKSEDEQVKLIKTTFEQELSPKDKLPMTLKITKNGFIATIGGKISFLYDVNDGKWHEVKIFGVTSNQSSLESYKLEFVQDVSKATIKLIKGYGIFTMNVTDRIEKIIALKMEECKKALDTITLPKVEVIKKEA